MKPEPRIKKSGKKSKRTIYAIAATVMIFVLVGYLLWFYQSNKEQKNALAEINNRLQGISNEKETYSQILSAEKLVLEGHFQKGIRAYEEILPFLNQSDREIIDNRISRIKSRIKNEGNEQLENFLKDSLLTLYRDSVEILNKDLEEFRLNMGTEFQTTTSQISNLKKELELKEKLLDQKENVQVISFTNANNVQIYYLGEVKDDKANGGGIGIWTSTGSIYRGEWKDNLRHGKGSFEWAEGERYVGEFIEDEREGKGTYYWPSGERYEGEWENSMRNGYGILYDPDGNIQIEGEWKDDKPV